MADSAYQTAGGTSTAITITTATLTNGYSKTFIASANNNGSATTVNGKPLYKPNTTTAPTLIAGKAYTVWYNLANDCFFIKASAEGTATTAQVLAGVPFSNETDTGLIGTMPNRGIFNLGLGASVPAGYYSGGTAPTGKRWASGTYVTSDNTITVSGLSFSPSIILIYQPNLNTQFQTVFNRKVSTTEFTNGDGIVYLNTGVYYVNSSGFKLHTYLSPPRNLTWLAFE